MHTVSLLRSCLSSGIRTVSMARPSWVRKRNFRVPSNDSTVPSGVRGASGAAASKASRKPRGTVEGASGMRTPPMPPAPGPCNQRNTCSARNAGSPARATCARSSVMVSDRRSKRADYSYRSPGCRQISNRIAATKFTGASRRRAARAPPWRSCRASASRCRRGRSRSPSRRRCRRG